MQRPNEKRRQAIMATAARLFATRPFHEVKLDDIAAAASVGKGTLYIYFDSKESLYLALMGDAFSHAMERLKQQLGRNPPAPAACLKIILTELTRIAFQHPHSFELMRAASDSPAKKAYWREKRHELMELIEGVLRRGIRSGQFTDANPALTARVIGGMVRSIAIHGTEGLDPDAVADHLFTLIANGIVVRSRKSAKRNLAGAI